jgi:hypothetical protein
LIAELFAIAIALAVGVPIAFWLDHYGPVSRVVGEGMLLGFGICAAMLCVMPWSRGMVIVALAAAACVAPAARRLDRRRLGGDFDKPPASRWRSSRRGRRRYALPLLAFAIVALTGYALYAIIAPPPEFDYLADWGLKARAFFEVRGIDWQLLGRAIARDTHPDYPLLLPLVYDFIAVLRNGWSDAYLGAVHVAFAAALLLVIYGSAIEASGSRTVAAFITAAIVPLAATPWIGMAEGPFIAYATAALLLIRRGNITFGAILLGLAASTKNEGLTLIAAVALGLLCARRAREIVRLWPAVAIPLPWLIARSMHQLPTDLVAGGVLDRVIAHLRDPRPLVSALFSVSLGKPLFWIALAIGVAIAFRVLVTAERFIIATLLLQFACYVGAYLATPYDVVWHVTYSWERLVSHLTPALTFVVLLALVVRYTGRMSDSLETSISSN